MDIHNNSKHTPGAFSFPLPNLHSNSLPLTLAMVYLRPSRASSIMQGTSGLAPQFYNKQPLQHSGSYRPFPPSGPDWILLHRGIGLFYAKKINPPDPLLTAVTLEASLLVFVVTVVHQFGSTYFRCKS